MRTEEAKCNNNKNEKKTEFISELSETKTVYLKIFHYDIVFGFL